MKKFEAASKNALELASLASSSKDFTYLNRFYVCEAAYLLIFNAWENFLEETMIRFIAGSHNSSGKMILKPGLAYQPDIASAKSALFNGHRFLLWHSPHYPIKRSQAWFNSGIIETVILSAQTDLEHFANIRHFIAHKSTDSKSKFDLATSHLQGVNVIGSSAGRFLIKQTVNSSGVMMSWNDKICEDLTNYAKQIAN